MACVLLIGRPMAPRARPGLEVGWATPAVHSLPPKAGRGLCAALARAGALCFEPDVEKNTKFTPQTHNIRQRNNILIGCDRSTHVPARSPGGESAARWGQARARRRRQRPRAASARRDAGGGQSRGGRRCGGGANNGGRDRRDRERAVAHNYSRGARRAPRQRANSATSTSEATLWRHARERRCTTRRWWRCLRRRAWHAHLR